MDHHDASVQEAESCRLAGHQRHLQIVVDHIERADSASFVHSTAVRCSLELRMFGRAHEHCKSNGVAIIRGDVELIAAVSGTRPRYGRSCHRQVSAAATSCRRVDPRARLQTPRRCASRSSGCERNQLVTLRFLPLTAAICTRRSTPPSQGRCRPGYAPRAGRRRARSAQSRASSRAGTRSRLVDDSSSISRDVGGVLRSTCGRRDASCPGDPIGLLRCR